MATNTLDLMAIAEGSPQHESTPKLRATSASLGKDRLSLFESAAAPSSPKRKLEVDTTTPTKPDVKAAPAKPDVKAEPVKPDVRADEAIDDGLTSSPRLAENPFKRSDSLKSGGPTSKPEGAATPTRRPSWESSGLAAKFEAMESMSAPTKSNDLPSRNSIGDNPFLRSDSAKRASLVPPWEKTAAPVVGQQPASPKRPSAYEDKLSSVRASAAAPAAAANVAKPQAAAKVETAEQPASATATGKLEAATPPAAAASQVEVDVVGDAPPTKTANACCILM